MKKNKNLPEVDPVELKSFLGLRPGIVIIIVGVLALLLIFFLTCMLPGIMKGGRMVSFTSDSSNVGVYIDGKYTGSTEGKRVFIESGDHEIEYIKDGVRFGKDTLHVDHPIFFTLFRVAKMDIDIEVPANDEIKKAVLENFTENLQLSSAILSYDAVTRYEPVLTHFAEDVTSLDMDISEDFWSYVIAHITSTEMKEDWENAERILAEAGKPVTADDSVLSQVTYGSNDNRYVNINEVTAVDHIEDGYAYYDGGKVTMGEYTGSVYPWTNEKNTVETVEPFAIAMDPVTEYDYALFVGENPEWSHENKEDLIKEGLVDRNYLVGVSLTTDFVSNKPVTNISAHAAEAYCEWLSEKEGENYRLPTEAEWIFAADSIQDKKPATSLMHKDLDTERPRNMMGLVWEFTSSPYVPLERMMEEKVMYIPGDIIIKGGSWLMRPGTYDQYSVGVASPSKCSEAFGFRVAKEI